MSAVKDGAFARMRDAEAEYLLAAGWKRAGGLWLDPLAPAHGHIDRVASNKQRQRDAQESNARAKAT